MWRRGECGGIRSEVLAAMVGCDRRIEADPVRAKSTTCWEMPFYSRLA